MKTLSAPEIESVLREYSGWKLHEGKLIHEWSFSNFIEAMKFVNRVATLAEDAGHHPDIDIRYNKVTLGLVSHDAGGITEQDAAMAGRISSEFGEDRHA